MARVLNTKISSNRLLTSLCIVRGDDVVEELLNDVLGLLLVSESFVDVFDHLFIGFGLPDAIATHDDEVIVGLYVDNLQIWVGSDGPFLRASSLY